MLMRGRPHSCRQTLVPMAMIIIYTSAFAIARADPAGQEAAVHGGPFSLLPDSRSLSSLTFRDSTPSRPLDTPEGHDSWADLLTEPMIASSASSGSAVSDNLQTKLEGKVRTGRVSSAGGASRGLLHGKHQRKRFRRCPNCRMVKCYQSGYCSGHCKKQGDLRFCDSNSRAPPFSPQPAPEPELCEPDSDGRDTGIEVKSDEAPHSSIAEFDTVVVTAEAPYIGCADIANRPSGCPARGTRATLPGGRQVSVLTSACKTETYVPDCGSPLLPFGVCECFYRDDPQRPPGGRSPPGPSPRRIIRAACSTAELAAGSGVGGTDGSPSEDGIVVQPAGDLTLTRFSDFIEREQLPTFSYNVTATTRSIDVHVSLDIYPEIVMVADFVGEDPVPIDPGDYEPDDYEGAEIE